MRMMLQATADLERQYIEAHILSVVVIGLDYGFDVVVDRYSSLTVVSLKQHYPKDAQRAMDSVEITLYHKHTGVYVERVIHKRNLNKISRYDSGSYTDFSNAALEHIMRIVWDIENE